MSTWDLDIDLVYHFVIKVDPQLNLMGKSEDVDLELLQKISLI